MIVPCNDLRKCACFHRKPQAGRPTVTICIGMICRHKKHPADIGKIVLATDSQTTYVSGPKNLSAKKINIVQFANGDVLTAQSGKARQAALAVETFQSKAKSEKITDFESVKSCLEESMREVRKSLLEGWGFTEERARTYLQLEADCEFLVAFHCAGKLHLCHIDNYYCTLCPTENHYSAIGVGSDLASYLLGEMNESDPEFEYSDF